MQPKRSRLLAVDEGANIVVSHGVPFEDRDELRDLKFKWDPAQGVWFLAPIPEAPALLEIASELRSRVIGTNKPYSGVYPREDSIPWLGYLCCSVAEAGGQTVWNGLAFNDEKSWIHSPTNSLGIYVLQDFECLPSIDDLPELAKGMDSHGQTLVATGEFNRWFPQRWGKAILVPPVARDEINVLNFALAALQQMIAVVTVDLKIDTRKWVQAGIEAGWSPEAFIKPLPWPKLGNSPTRRAGRPPTARSQADQVLSLASQGMNQSEIAITVGISRRSVARILGGDRGNMTDNEEQAQELDIVLDRADENPRDYTTWMDQSDPKRWALKFALEAYDVACDGKTVDEYKDWATEPLITAWDRADAHQQKILLRGFRPGGDETWDKACAHEYRRLLGIK